METNSYCSIFLKNFLQLLGFVWLLSILFARIRNVIFWGSADILLRSEAALAASRSGRVAAGGSQDGLGARAAGSGRLHCRPAERDEQEEGLALQPRAAGEAEPPQGRPPARRQGQCQCRPGLLVGCRAGLHLAAAEDPRGSPQAAPAGRFSPGDAPGHHPQQRRGEKRRQSARLA